MKTLYLSIVALIGAAFLAMLAVAFLPSAPSGAGVEGPGETASAPAPAARSAVVAPLPDTYAAGLFTETDRSDLRPRPAETLEYSPDVEGAERHFLVRGFRPRNYSAYDGGTGEVPRPVIVLFHGAGRTPLSMIDMWQEAADANGLLLVSIASATEQWTLEEAEAGVVLDIIEDAATQYTVDGERIFLFGHSSGAVMAQYLANHIAGPWKAVAVHGGTYPTTAIRPRVDAVPIQHYLGGSDAIFPSYDARLSGQAMAQAGHDFDLALIPGHTHWFYVGGPAFAADAWSWFSELTAGGA
ncbi:dienelactone hydrolase family protein [Roseibacterium sp. SDUM158016]|uniref:dienelactone hydrolase family protein n=1 Tax=Roseicyclus sediminis TaxID=2980997 RepID=UPI0021D14703|nr:dienelactone hydrolase family protein [Roseibacterium sp. SDUM158016]MCU4654129.1 dienelactone hydrolase family protein [Roseibacterium sp. SDUM158016]